MGGDRRNISADFRDAAPQADRGRRVWDRKGSGFSRQGNGANDYFEAPIPCIISCTRCPGGPCCRKSLRAALVCPGRT